MQDTQTIWQFLYGIPIGQIVSWLIVIGAIMSSVCGITIKAYKIFEKYKEAKEKDERQQKIIESHDETLKNISSALNEIKTSLEIQKDVNLKQIRHTLVSACEEALNKGEITTNGMRSLEEIYDEYVKVFNGNGYVKTLMLRVRKLRTSGKFDD